jgi:hypothetical protein
MSINLTQARGMILILLHREMRYQLTSDRLVHYMPTLMPFYFLYMWNMFDITTVSVNCHSSLPQTDNIQIMLSHVQSGGLSASLRPNSGKEIKGKY